jgi:hypothetical protein
VTNQKSKVVLIGASVGKAWDIRGFPQRVGSDRYRTAYIGVYHFDKSEAVEQALSDKKDPPDAVILKECAAYFPSDISFADSKRLIKQWIGDIRKHRIIPIPATVAPVTPEHDDRFKTHNPLKIIVKRILGISMMTRIERICEYNDWIAAYAETEGLPLLDLEGALRRSDTDRFLREELTSGDGLHLNNLAYQRLDAALKSTLDDLFSDV